MGPTVSAAALTPVERVLNALVEKGSNPRRSGDGWSARCPAHDDSSPSLSISVGADDKALVCCQAGCSVDAVLGALGLTLTDLFSANGYRAGDKPTIVTTYDYVDQFGSLLYQVVRMSPKGFRQRRPDGRGDWIWDLNGTTRVLYRLPRIRQAVAAGDTVWICEGEKDVDALERAGYIATCNPGGAGKWRDDYSATLAGVERVMVVADRDEPGRRHAAQVAASLRGHVGELLVVEPVEGKDAADHVAAGRTVDEFEVVELDDAADTDVIEDRAEDGRQPPKESTATQLVRLAEQRYRFALDDAGRAFAVTLNGPPIAKPVSGALRAELAAEFFARNGRAAGRSALIDACAVLERRAALAGRESLALRASRLRDGRVVVDLGGPDGRAVVVTPGAGWCVVERSPCTFRRTELTAALPEPVAGGSMDELAELMNVSDADWPVVIGWLFAALLPDLPRPVMSLGGEHGSGKSTAARDLASTVDPSPAPLRSSPRDLEAWIVAAAGSQVVALDNLSSIPEWLSDALCRAATGEGLVRPALYTDGDLAVTVFRRAIILTSIDPGALRGDLADRLLLVELEPITSERRRSDAQLAAEFDERHPRILGALLDVLAGVLGELPGITLAEPPRMADFAHLLAALDTWGGTAALDRYRASLADVVADVLASDPLAQAVITITADHTWSGTATDLLKLVDDYRPDRGSWPRTPKALGGALRRLAPALRSVGLEVEMHRTPAARMITLRRAAGRTQWRK
jgi:hypothetical protein